MYTAALFSIFERNSTAPERRNIQKFAEYYFINMLEPAVESECKIKIRRDSV
jgi:hypothetical protein